MYKIESLEQVGIHSRKQRAVPATATPGEVEIAGPVGQHSNTPFRRNRSATVIKIANDKSASPPPTSPASFSLTSSPTVTNSRKTLPVLQKVHQQQSSSNAISNSTISGLKYKEIGKSQDREEGDMDFGCVVECDQSSSAVLRRNSSTRSPARKEGGMKRNDDEHDDSMEFKRASRRLSRYIGILLIFLIFCFIFVTMHLFIGFFCFFPPHLIIFS